MGINQNGPTRPALRYHGGKWMLAPWIIDHFPAHRIYVEPFGGAASIMLRKHRAYAEVYNDAWGDVVNVFRVLRDPVKAERLRTLIELTPFSRAEYTEADDRTDDDVENARRMIFHSLASFGSGASRVEYKTGFRANANRAGTTPAHDWRNYPEAIPAFVDRLRGVIIEARPAIDIMAQHDSAETLHYVDPPYLPETRRKLEGGGVYAYEMTPADHAALLDFLRGLEGMVVLSGYPSRLYDEALHDWRCLERLWFADGANERTEVLWLNPAAEAKRTNSTGFLFAHFEGE